MVSFQAKLISYPTPHLSLTLLLISCNAHRYIFVSQTEPDPAIVFTQTAYDSYPIFPPRKLVGMILIDLQAVWEELGVPEGNFNCVTSIELQPSASKYAFFLQLHNYQLALGGKRHCHEICLNERETTRRVPLWTRKAETSLALATPCTVMTIIALQSRFLRDHNCQLALKREGALP